MRLLAWNMTASAGNILSGVTSAIDTGGGFLSGLFTAGKDAVTSIDWGSVGGAVLNGVTGVIDTAGGRSCPARLRRAGTQSRS